MRDIIVGLWPLAMILAFHIGPWFTGTTYIEFTPRKDNTHD
jgi:hypothetical protein